MKCRECSSPIDLNFRESGIYWDCSEHEISMMVIEPTGTDSRSILVYPLHDDTDPAEGAIYLLI